MPGPTMSGPAMSDRAPLDGIRILDLSRVLAGPWATQTLSDLGAEVWKVESIGAGDDTRSWKPPETGGQSTYYLCCNRGKRSLAVDLKTPGGRELVLDLARRADVVVENFRPSSLRGLGLGYEDLSAANPGLIHCSITGYGRGAADPDRPGYDFLIQAECGLMSITGEAEGAPVRVGVAVIDLVTGMNAVQAILAALYARTRTGRGQRVEVSLFDCGVQLLANVASGHLNTGEAPARHGNAHPTVLPYQIFPTADGELVLAVGNDRQFAVLCRDVLEDEALAGDGRFATNAARVGNRRALIDALSAVLRTRPTGDWLCRLRGHGIPCGEVRTVPEVFATPDARALVAEAPHPTAGSVRMVRSPLRLSDTPVRAPTAPPLLGADTEPVLRDVLGLCPEAVAALRAAGAIG